LLSDFMRYDLATWGGLKKKNPLFWEFRTGLCGMQT